LMETDATCCPEAVPVWVSKPPTARIDTHKRSTRLIERLPVMVSFPAAATTLDNALESTSAPPMVELRLLYASKADHR
jgi:hypothetical protein